MKLENFHGTKERGVLDRLSLMQLRELRVDLLMKISEYESAVHSINDILEARGFEDLECES